MDWSEFPKSTFYHQEPIEPKRIKTMVKELPIGFTVEMVKAVREGRKTVTRRVMKHQPEGNRIILSKYRNYSVCAEIKDGEIMWRPFGGAPLQPMPNDEIVKHARYQPGDLLWVKESFGIVSKSHPLIKQTLPMFEYTHFSRTKPDCLQRGYELLYKATQEIDPDFPIRWRSSRFMPKWVTRTWLEVVSVRPERVQDINPEECYAEGIESQFSKDYKNRENIPVMPLIKRFIRLWDSINAKRGYPWESNPFVWRIEFKEYSR